MKYLCTLGYEDSWAGDEEDDPRGFEDCAPNMWFKVPEEAYRIDQWLARGYKVIFMVRHPRGCWTSRTHRQKDHDRITPGRARRWNQMGEIYLKYFRNDERVALVKYENLINHPDRVQKRLAERFGLKIRRPFSECWKYKSEFDDRPGLLGGIHVDTLRPIEPKKSRLLPKNLSLLDKKYIQNQSNQWPRTRQIMKEFGYDPKTL